MDKDILEGKWKQLKGQAKVQWGKLTEDDLEVIGGQKDKLVGKLQEVYGKSKDEAEAEVKRFWSKL